MFKLRFQNDREARIETEYLGGLLRQVGSYQCGQIKIAKSL